VTIGGAVSSVGSSWLPVSGGCRFKEVFSKEVFSKEVFSKEVFSNVSGRGGDGEGDKESTGDTCRESV
jgi:hypothetical protein